MRITAKVVEDSISPDEVRLTTMQIEYPRFIHAEFMTHRVFSRNASSSRAIPVEKLIQQALDDPAFFVEIGANRPGMQAKELVAPDIAEQFREEWEELAEIVAGYCRRWSKEYNIHKQIVNRPMESWHHISVVVSATDWDNFFQLRDHEDAQPEIRALAIRMREAMEASQPTELKYKEWHLPYVKPEERARFTVQQLRKISAARCARVSYLNHDGTNPDIMKDLELFDKLAVSFPPHLSPTEHQASAAINNWLVNSSAAVPWRSNFRGWVQFRKYIEQGRIDG